MNIKKYEVWKGDLFIGYVYSEAEADEAWEAGCRVFDLSK